VTGQVRSWDAVTGKEVVPCPDPAPNSGSHALSPDGRRIARARNQDVVIEPRVLVGDTLFLRRLYDPLLDHAYRLERAREAQQANDAFALAFHLRPLLLGSLGLSAARPRDSFPLWTRRPPVTASGARLQTDAVSLTGEQRNALEAELTREIESSKRWEAWAGRGWLRHLRGDGDGAIADLRQAIAANGDEPALWALRGVISLRHGRHPEAAEARAKRASWPGLDVTAWHVAEASACEAEGATSDALWHLQHLAAKAPTAGPLVRLGQLYLRQGREADAAAAFAKAVARHGSDHEALAWHARLCIASGDEPGYRQACNALAKDAPKLLRVAVLRPAALTDMEAVLKQSYAYLGSPFVHGGLLLRAGKPGEAVGVLRRGLGMPSPADYVTSLLLLSLAERQLGRKAEAQAALAEARWQLHEPALRAGMLRLGPAGAWGTLAATAATPPLAWEVQLEVRLLLKEAEAAVAAP
jgi:tetratricopeptide (TPR) repeat protein